MLKWLSKKRNQKGFTLIELVVVIAILGILAALAIPRLTGSRDKANRSAVLANLRTIESALTIAEAEGKTMSGGIGNAETENSLVKGGYLNAAPSGPKGVANYGINTSNRATVTFAAVPEGGTVNYFGFTGLTGTGPFTLDELVEP